MKKQSTTFYVISSFFIWGTITLGFLLSMCFNFNFYIRLVLGILSLTFLVLFLFYLRKL